MVPLELLHPSGGTGVCASLSLEFGAGRSREFFQPPNLQPKGFCLSRRFLGSATAGRQLSFGACDVGPCFDAHLRELRPSRRTRLPPDFGDGIRGGNLEPLRQVRMVDFDPRLRPKLFPEFGQGVGRRAHGAAPGVLVELAGGRRDPVPKEQQRADFAVQRFCVQEPGFQGLDLALDLGFGTHGLIIQRITLSLMSSAEVSGHKFHNVL